MANPVRKHLGVFSLSIAAILCALLAAGCSASRLKYTKNDADPASPPNGGFAFALHAATVVLTKTANKTSPASQPSGGAHPPTSPPAGTAASSPTEPYAATCERPKAPSAPPSENKPQTNWWRDCLRGTSSSVVAVSSGAVYVASPDNGMFSTTKVTPKVSDSDPLLVNSVTFNTTSTIPGAITAAGTGAAAGFAFGPWGAVIGGVIGAAGVFAPGATGKAAPIANAGWWDFACDGQTEYPRYMRLKDVGSATLSGPVTMDFTSVDNRTAQETTLKAVPECWRPLPVSASGGYQPEAQPESQAEASGWFYRFVPNQSPPPRVTALPPMVYNVYDASGKTEVKLASALQPADDYFTAAGSSGQDTFPVAACRAVDLQITWWQEFDANTGDPTHKVELVSFPLTVADPAYVQKIASPKQGAITLLPVCGGYASAGGPSTDLNDSISNLIKQVQAVKDAETKWATPAKK